MSPSESHRVLVVGAGSIGRRHLANIKSLGLAEVAVCRRSTGDAAATRSEFGVPAFASLEAASSWGATSIVVANATSVHVETASWAVAAGNHVFIEKPISHTLEGVDQLLQNAAEAGCVVGIGSNLRFHPAIEKIREVIVGGELGRLLSVRTEVGSYLPDWHAGNDYRTEYSARPELGGGAALTLIHELDFAMWIAGDIDNCSGKWGHVSGLEIDVEDIVEIIAEHTSGTITSVHLDFLDRSYNRRSRWICEQGSLEWRWGEALWMLLPGGRRANLWHDEEFDLNETYVNEMRDFLCAANGQGRPRTTGGEGLRILQVLLESARG